MFKANITTPVAATADTDIPFTTVIRTNGNVVSDGTQIRILKPGFYNVSLTMSATAGAIGTPEVSLYNNGNIIAETTSERTLVANASTTFVINDILNIVPGIIDNVRLSVRSTAALNIDNAVLTITKIR